MTVIAPVISGNTTDINSLPVNFNTSTLLAKGGAIPMSNGVQAYAWLPIDVLDPDDATVRYKLDLTPQYEGQLFWSAVDGTFPTYTLTNTSALLYISVHYTKVPITMPTFFNEYYWIPVKLEKLGTYIDPTTGKTWDPMGAYTCNPPYLCAD